MIYELSFDGYRLGLFPTEAEAVRRADYLPKGRYTLREWEKDGEFSTFDPSVNKSYDFNNWHYEKASICIQAQRPVADRIGFRGRRFPLCPDPHRMRGRAPHKRW